MQRIIILVVASLTVSAVLADEIDYYTGILNGNAWLEASELQQVMYVTGAIDGLVFASVFDPDMSQVFAFAECCGGMTVAQITAIVHKYLDQHPEDSHEPMNYITFEAITTNCPTW
jgi:hypothetical protein